MSRGRAALPRPVPPRWRGALLALVLGAGCSPGAGEDPGWLPDRRHYAAFRERHPELLEPNYLPFMLFRVRSAEPPGTWLVTCRWDDSEMPLPIHVTGPEIPDSVQDEFHPVPPAAYRDAVEQALSAWEGALEGRVRFARVERPEEARLVVSLLAETGPAPDDGVQVLGATRGLARACRVEGPVGPGDAPLPVRFRASRLDVYVADANGLLTPSQVETIALHELGHALGMQGHSPLPSDFMYPIVRERPPSRGLSDEDVHSFLDLYSLPNGTRYAFLPDAGLPPRPPPRPPTPQPELALAPQVDARFGLELRWPRDWIRMETPRGVFASDGPEWDRDASIELAVFPFPDMASLWRRHAGVLFAGTRLVSRGPWVVAGRPAWALSVRREDEGRAQEFLFTELGGGRVLMILFDCPAEFAGEWRPWFQAVVSTLEIRGEKGEVGYPARPARP